MTQFTKTQMKINKYLNEQIVYVTQMKAKRNRNWDPEANIWAEKG